MTKAEHWFPLYVGDYLADTGHLTAAEHGAYLLLLMHQWRNGSIPADERQLSKITRQTLPEWRRMAETILAFFDTIPEGFSQKRLERERARAAEHSERRSEKARKAANLRWKGDATSMLGALPEHSPSNACECPTQPQPQPDRDTSLRSVSLPRAKRAASSPDFADFWQAYPRKVGKGAAEKAFNAALAKGATVADIAGGLNRQRWPADPRFIPHPATWLNQARWQDDPAAAAPTPQPADQPGKLDWLWQEMRERQGAEDFPDFSSEPRKLLQ